MEVKGGRDDRLSSNYSWRYSGQRNHPDHVHSRESTSPRKSSVSRAEKSWWKFSIQHVLILLDMEKSNWCSPRNHYQLGFVVLEGMLEEKSNYQSHPALHPVSYNNNLSARYVCCHSGTNVWLELRPTAWERTHTYTANETKNLRPCRSRALEKTCHYYSIKWTQQFKNDSNDMLLFP